MIIDVHQHVCWSNRTIEAVAENLDEHGIDRCWVMTWETPPEDRTEWDHHCFDPRRSNMPFEDVVEACRRFPDRFIPGYAPDPRDPESFRRLENAVAMYGVRVYGECKFRLQVDDPRCVQMFRLCGRLGLPVLIHFDEPFLPPDDLDSPAPSWYGGTLDNLERALTACPETILIGHGPGWWRHISGDGASRKEAYPKGPIVPGGRAPELMRRHENLYADISAGSGATALQRDLGFSRDFLNEFQDRVMFGRDSYGDGHMKMLESLELSREIMDNILSGNALRLVPLEPAG